VAVGENEDNLVFLRKIIPWWIKKSFWLEVAKIAGLSNSIITEARKMLKILELEHNKISATQMLLWVNEPEVKIIEKEVFRNSKIEQELKNIKIEELTPIDALNKLNELKNKI
jgi:DNA mismatch repair protein MutS